MKTSVLAACILIAVAPSVWGGVNANGGMIVHTNDLYTYSAGTRCTTPYVQDLGVCMDAITRTDLQESVLWLLAVFSESSNPRVSGLCTGISYDPDLYVEDYWLCAPAGSFEIPDQYWPNSETYTNIAFGQTIAGDLVIPFYGFLVWNAGEIQEFCTKIDGMTGFSDDSNPPVWDTPMFRGCVRWYAPGYTTCGGPENGACCITDLCFILPESECSNQGGSFLEGLPCAPNPCLSGAQEPAETPAAVAFDLVTPNPTRGPIHYRVTLQEPATVVVKLYDAGGRWLEDLMLQDLPAGSHDFSWSPSAGGQLTSGVYSLRLEARLLPAANGMGTTEATAARGRFLTQTQRVVLVR